MNQILARIVDVLLEQGVSEIEDCGGSFCFTKYLPRGIEERAFFTFEEINKRVERIRQKVYERRTENEETVQIHPGCGRYNVELRCPRCGSHNIKILSESAGPDMWWWYLECKDCSNKGHNMPTIDAIIQDKEWLGGEK